MSRLERNWQYAEQYPNETDAQVSARRLSLELGIEPVSRAVAAQLSGLIAATGATSICELGTGVGVSGLALLRYAPNAMLTTVERDPEFLRQAKSIFAEGGVPNSQLRLVQGDAVQVMSRLNLGSYDVVFIDANPEDLLEYIELALQITRPGGTIAVANAFAHGGVTNPASRDTASERMRDLLATMSDSPAVAPVLSPAGDGLLMLTRLQG